MHLRLCSPRSGRWGSEGRDAEVRGFGSSGVQGFGARRSGLGQSPRPGRGCGQRPGAVGTLDRPIPAALPAPREGGKKGRREEKNKSEGAKPSRHREGREGGRREAARHGSAGKPEKLLQQRSVACPPARPAGRHRAGPPRRVGTAPRPSRAAQRRSPPGGRGERGRGESPTAGEGRSCGAGPCQHPHGGCGPESRWLGPHRAPHPRGVNTQSHGRVSSMSSLGLGQTLGMAAPFPALHTQMGVIPPPALGAVAGNGLRGTAPRNALYTLREHMCVCH